VIKQGRMLRVELVVLRSEVRTEDNTYFNRKLKRKLTTCETQTWMERYY